MIEKIFKKYKIKAKKSLGQNFLVNDKIVEEISNCLNIKWKNIVEVWPWYGALTEKILNKNPKALQLIELDNDMIDILNDRIKNWELINKNIDFEIRNIDVLKYSPPFKGGVEGEYFIIANIPYYITSPILKHFLYDVENKPEKMLILMQKDVGDKILKTSPPAPLLTWEGSKKKNKSSVIWLMMAKKAFVREVLFVWKQNFIPAPKVESSVLLFEKHNLYDDLDDLEFLDFIKKWFCEPRKKLIKNLIKNWLDKDKILKIYSILNLSENIRAEELNLNKWIEFINLYKKS